MKRLTNWDGDRAYIIGLKPFEMYVDEEVKIRAVVERLATYEDAEEQRRLVILPCKVGDTVYKLWYAPCHNGETYPDGMGCDGCIDRCDIHKEVTEFTVPDVNFIWVNFVMKGNTTYYLTRAEAEAALKGETQDV